jgi:hypothetical protein
MTKRQQRGDRTGRLVIEWLKDYYRSGGRTEGPRDRQQRIVAEFGLNPRYATRQRVQAWNYTAQLELIPEGVVLTSSSPHPDLRYAVFPNPMADARMKSRQMSLRYLKTRTHGVTDILVKDAQQADATPEEIARAAKLEMVDTILQTIPR